MTDALITLQLRLPGLDAVAAQAWLDELTWYLAHRPGLQPTIEAQAVSETDLSDDRVHTIQGDQEPPRAPGRARAHRRP